MSDAFKSIAAGSTRGTKPWRNNDLVNTGQVIKASPGSFFGGIVHNSNAAARYLKIYNRAVAPTASDVPVFTIFCPAQSNTPIPAPPAGVEFNAGISVRATTGLADNDNTAPTAGDLFSTLYFY